MGGSFVKALTAAAVLALVGSSAVAGAYEKIIAKPLSKTYFYGDYWIDAEGDWAKKLSITVGYAPGNPGEELLELHVNRNKQMMLLVIRLTGETNEVIHDIEKMSPEEINRLEQAGKERIDQIKAQGQDKTGANVNVFKLVPLVKGMNCILIQANWKNLFHKEADALLQCSNRTLMYQFRLSSVNRDLHWTWIEDLKAYAKFKLEEWRPEWETGAVTEIPPSVADSINEILPPPGEEMPPQLEKLPLMPMPGKTEPAKAPVAVAPPAEKVEKTPLPAREAVGSSSKVP